MAIDWIVGLVAIASALTIGVTALASAMAEKTIAIAGIGAIAENENLFGKVLVLTVIPETIVIFGLVISMLIIGIA